MILEPKDRESSFRREVTGCASLSIGHRVIKGCPAISIDSNRFTVAIILIQHYVHNTIYFPSESRRSTFIRTLGWQNYDLYNCYYFVAVVFIGRLRYIPFSIGTEIINMKKIKIHSPHNLSVRSYDDYRNNNKSSSAVNGC